MHRRAAVVALAGIALAVSTALAPVAAGSPTTVTKYPVTAASTSYAGLGFEACTAPSLATMTAWLASPYRAVGVYVGGRNRSCTQPELTASWVSSVTALGWRLLPTYLGRQAPCAARGGTKISTKKATATTQGTAAANSAIAAVSALGIAPGSPVYYDLENYDSTDASCRTSVLTFLSAYTKRLHARGYVSGVYANLGSGAKHLAKYYTSTSYARPDAVWVARWDGSPALTGLKGVSDDYWSSHQRVKQYRGDHTETYGGATLNIDSDNLDSPVASVGRPYVTELGTTNLRTGPSTHTDTVGPITAGTPVTVLCQTHGTDRNGTEVWDKLATGRYVSDYFVSTPSNTTYSPGIPLCAYPYQVTVTDSLSKRVSPKASAARAGKIKAGGLAWVKCQTKGTETRTTSVWNRLVGNTYVTDRYVATASDTTYTSPVPRCY